MLNITRQISRLPILGMTLAVAVALSPAASTKAGPQAAQTTPTKAQDRARTEIPYRDGTVVLESDYQERISQTRYRAKGNVEIRFQDVLLACDEVEYDEETRQGATKGKTRFSQNKQWLTCSHAEFNFADQTGVFYEASGYTDQEFLLQGRTIRKLSADKYEIESGFITACQDKVPKWSFRVSRAGVRVDHTARLHHTVFKLKGVPVLYFPYLVVPMEKKERSSGFMPFHTGTSTTKGREFRLGYFQTLGDSADVTVYGDYFSLRGTAFGGILRARPNPQTRFYLFAYGIKDKLGQGGAHLIVDGDSQFANGFRAVASVNITSNFRFRQAFSDSFRSATIPLEQSAAFLTRNSGSYSLNLSFRREEVRFPTRSLVIRTSPSVEFSNLGQQIGHSPFSLDFRLSADGLSRVDSVIETPSLVQRLDFFPHLTLRLPSLGGFSVLPRAGIRETYYSAHLEDKLGSSVVGGSLHRQYSEFELDLRTPTLERDFHNSLWGDFRHVVEPFAIYRRINGVDNLRQTIRFDSQDAVADTNEVEYGVVNRILRSRETRPGIKRTYEFLSLSLTQKYYFDPEFGKSFRPGEQNSFYPLYTLTGFGSSSTPRNLSPTSLALRVTPMGGITYDVRADYDSKYQRLRDTSVSAYLQQEKLFLAGTYFKTNAIEPGLIESHQIQGQAGYGSPLHGLSASVTLSYNIQTARLLNSQSRLHYAWDCCGVAMEFQQFDLGLRTETRFFFSFSLKGIGNFGNIKRPESLF